jgi:predicted nucleic acid binding AN1-type Zn finger protein
MPNCEICGEYDYFKYECQFCKKNFCVKHQLPEEHNCQGLKILKEECRDGFKLSASLMKEKGYIDKDGKYKNIVEGKND